MTKSKSQRNAVDTDFKLQMVKAGRLLATLREFESFIRTLDDNRVSPLELKKLRFCIADITKHKSDYADIHDELVVAELDLSDLIPVTEFSAIVWNLCSEAELILEKHSHSENSSSTSSTCASSAAHSDYHRSLPNLQLPTFNGKISEYSSFVENFKSIVDRVNIDPVQKLLYLRSSLKGDAATCINGLAVTNDNYNIALQVLDSRYYKPKLIIQSHINNIFELNSVIRGSPSSLQQFLDNLNRNLLCLKNLNVTNEKLAAALLAHIVESKLDCETKEKLKKFCPTELLSIDDILKFLQDRALFLTDIGVEQQPENCHVTKNRFSKGASKPLRSRSLVATDTKQIRCYLCKENHTIFNCSQFLALSPEQRSQKIRDLKVCLNCLRHPSSYACPSKFTCATCKKLHHTLLHFSKEVATVQEPSTSSSTPSGSDNPLSLTCSGQSNKRMVLLSTAEVIIQDRKGLFHKVRCLLDSGSMENLITAELARKLELPEQPTVLSLAGVNCKSTKITKFVKAVIRSQITNFQKSLPLLVIDQITSQVPSVPFNLNVDIPSNLKLADPHFNIPSDIDLLIGASLFYELLCVGQVACGSGGPVFQKTKLGYVATGRVTLFPRKESLITSNCNISLSPPDFDIQKFWEIENVKPPSPKSLLSKEEQLCEDNFDQTTYRSTDGKYVVSIPFNNRIKELGSSFHIALNRFYLLEEKLNKNPQLKQQYCDFIQEYLDLNHLTELPLQHNQNLNFLPHHGVLKPESTTTKLRVVFDGSAKTDSGLSINDCQLLGPVVQRDLFSILLNFRQYRVALTADCEKMYRQVWLTPEQRKYQNILWRNNPSADIKVLQLNTVTYGLTSSSYLATKCLQNIALQNKTLFPEAFHRILNDFYVDDFISGANSVPEAKNLIAQITQILSQAGFPLRKFLSNDPSIFSKPSQPDIALSFKETESKTLGIQWHPYTDQFQYKISFSIATKSVTKRELLSTISKLFDPLGLIAPLIITAKLIMQEVWKLQLNWDETIPMSLQSEWTTFARSLSKTRVIKIPRYIFSDEALYVELHGFCDASTRAYGACIYVRCVFSNSVRVRLLCSKSRVAPLKSVTLPRLELSSAVLLAELTSKVQSIFSNGIKNVFYWSDSKIALSWIQAAPNRFKTFVANRIALIQDLTSIENWLHCKGSDNPADLVSRGCSIDKIANQNLWFEGPHFLSLPSFQVDSPDFSHLDLPELKDTHVALAISTTNDFADELFNKFSSLTKLQRTVAYVLRFIKNVRTSSESRCFTNLSVSELDESLLTLTRLCQQRCFEREIKALREKSIDSLKNLRLRCLSVFLDERGLLRVGGRIRHSNLSFHKVHPLLLPKGHAFSKLIASYYHKKYLHCGANHLLSVIRDRFWPMSGRNMCRQIVRNCIICFRAKPVVANNLMGELPSFRLTMHRPCFFHTGVDFAGPINIRDRYTRGHKLVKAYVVLFVCMNSKAIHLDLVTSLTSSAFIEVFKRFISRRGKPTSMFSDNAKNFVAAANELRVLHEQFQNKQTQSELHNYLLLENISWQFIPPASPHFGGMWESNIKCTKSHLSKILRDANLTYEGLYTVLVQIESVLNSRPLSPLSSDPNDMSPLTPYHFLLGQSHCPIRDASLDDVPENRLNVFQRRQQLLQHFWRRWSREVLPELQRRLKWSSTATEQLRIGKLVLIADPQSAPFNWPLARVVSVHPGSDKKVRVVSVRTASGSVLKRAITQLCVLPNQVEL